MKNKISLLLMTLILLSSLFVISTTTKVSAHPAKKHKTMICILEKDRTEKQKNHCKTWKYWHRMCKLDQDCAVLEIEKQEGVIGDLEDKLADVKGGVAFCIDIPFNHEAAANTKVYQKPNTKSKIIAEVKKGSDLLYFTKSKSNKNWAYVKIKKDKGCADGFIEEEFVVNKGGKDIIVDVDPNKLIEIKYPNWTKEDKLILVDAEGSASITGAVSEGKIDQIIINDEEEIINSDNTFTYTIFVPSSGTEVRIIGNKNGEKVKELIFKVKVGK